MWALPVCWRFRLRVQLSLFLLALLITPPTNAQKQDEKALALLDQARSISGLTSAGLPAYRLEASFETFDDKGQQDGTGTVVQVGLPDGRVKRVVTYRGKTSVRVHSDDWHGFADDDYLETFTERRLINAVFEPVPAARELLKRTITLEPLKSGEAKLECVVVSVPVPDATNDRRAAPSNAYCVDAELGMLRILIGHGGFNTVLNQFRKLGTAHVAGDVSIFQGKVKRGQLRVEKFQTAPSLTAADVVLPEPGPGQTDALRTLVGHDIIQGRIVQKTTPRYPEIAKRNHISGAVTLNAIIGRDGTIRDLELLTAPDDSLAASAISAVQTWRYKPYLLDGKPVEVWTTITVNYSFAQVPRTF